MPNTEGWPFGCFVERFRRSGERMSGKDVARTSSNGSKDMEPNLNANLGEIPAAWVDQGIAHPNTCGTMEDLTLRAGVREGVAIDSLEFGTTLVVRTRHSEYRLGILNGASGDVFVEGGNLLEGVTLASLNGATAGGSALKLGWIGVGLRMEFSVGGVRVTTSPVRSIDIENAGGGDRITGRTQ
jgi:hypothetical protein